MNRPVLKLKFSPALEERMRRERIARQEALEARQQKEAHAARVAAVEAIKARWPVLFDDRRPMPLAIGISTGIRSELGLPTSRISFALNRLTRRKAYLIALSKKGAMRHDLSGTPVEPVSDEHRAVAKASLKRRQRIPSPPTKPVNKR